MVRINRASKPIVRSAEHYVPARRPFINAKWYVRVYFIFLLLVQSAGIRTHSAITINIILLQPAAACRTYTWLI